jgi:hypothetical protein
MHGQHAPWLQQCRERAPLLCTVHGHEETARQPGSAEVEHRQVDVRVPEADGLDAVEQQVPLEM